MYFKAETTFTCRSNEEITVNNNDVRAICRSGDIGYMEISTFQKKSSLAPYSKLWTFSISPSL